MAKYRSSQGTRERGATANNEPTPGIKTSSESNPTTSTYNKKIPEDEFGSSYTSATDCSFGATSQKLKEIPSTCYVKHILTILKKVEKTLEPRKTKKQTLCITKITC